MEMIERLCFANEPNSALLLWKFKSYIQMAAYPREKSRKDFGESLKQLKKTNIYINT
jgi:hypothetical protein